MILIETSLLDEISVNGRISKRLFEKVVIPRLKSLENEIELLKAKNQQLLECVEFYANPTSWGATYDDWDKPCEYNVMWDDKMYELGAQNEFKILRDGVEAAGEFARYTLKKVEEIK